MTRIAPIIMERTFTIFRNKIRYEKRLDQFHLLYSGIIQDFESRSIYRVFISSSKGSFEMETGTDLGRNDQAYLSK
jgi:hypothetical protein